MVFSSMTFLCVFLPVVFLLYMVFPGIKMKNAFLILASLIFYAYGEPVYVLLLVAASFMNFLCAIMVDRFQKAKKTAIVIAVFLNLEMLIIFKYSGFLCETISQITGLTLSVPEIKMPIGISFFTFQAMSYVIDVYRGTVQVQKNFGKVLLYISFFPQLIAGPIVKYHDIELEIGKRKVTADGVSEGIRRFICGLSKKVLVANTMGMVADTLFTSPIKELNGLCAWLGAVSYLFQIYFDFSGYSDMAIGLGWIFGFHFRENFNYPYVSSSIQEFWRRWHISLSGWFKEYLYIPLGGNRKGKFRTVINKMIVFLTTGIWHGASWNFVFWGAYHGMFLLLEEYIPAISRKGGRVKSFLQHVYTVLVVCIGFVFFRAESMAQGVRWVALMFTDFSVRAESMNLLIQQLTPVYNVTFIAAVVAALPVTKWLQGKKGMIVFSYVASMAGFILCILSLSGGTYNPFIYFRF